MARALFALLIAIVAATVYLFSRTWLPPISSPGFAAIDGQLGRNFVWLGIAFCSTQVALGLFVWKYREQAVRHSTIAAQPTIRTELAWLVTAAVLFLFLDVAAVLLDPQRFPSFSGHSTNVEVTGVQFRWYFRYAGPDGKLGRTKSGLVDTAEGNPLGIDRSDPASADDVVTTTLMVPQKEDVILNLRSQDVIHSFFVPSARLKQDAVPGEDITLRLPPINPGVYDIACAQLCGMGHYQMNAKLKVVPKAEYQAWLAQQSAAKVAQR